MSTKQPFNNSTDQLFNFFNPLICTERDEKGKMKKEKGRGEKSAGASIHLLWRGATRQPDSPRKAANCPTLKAPL